MELTIYFDEKSIVLTDDKAVLNNKAIAFKNNSDIQFAIDSLKNQTNAILYHEDFQNLLNQFKANFKYIEAAGGFILNEFDEYLFIFRREKWDLPKGKLEAGETPEIAAIREVQEETGLQNVTMKQYRCSTWHTYELRGEHVLKQTYWYDMTAAKNQGTKPQTEEQITELQWLTKKDFAKVFANTFPSIISVINSK